MATQFQCNSFHGFLVILSFCIQVLFYAYDTIIEGKRQREVSEEKRETTEKMDWGFHSPSFSFILYLFCETEWERLVSYSLLSHPLSCSTSLKFYWNISCKRNHCNQMSLMYYSLVVYVVSNERSIWIFSSSFVRRLDLHPSLRCNFFDQRQDQRLKLKRQKSLRLCIVIKEKGKCNSVTERKVWKILSRIKKTDGWRKREWKGKSFTGWEP